MSLARPHLRSSLCAGLVLTLFAGSSVAVGQTIDGERSREALTEYDLIPDIERAAQVNDNTVGLVFSSAELFNAALGDLDREVQEHGDIRLVPIRGKNDVQNVYDLLYLQGVDGAVFRADALEYVARNGNFPTVRNVVNAMVSIHTDKVAVLADKSIESVDDLAGRKVALGEYASGEFITGGLLLDTFGLEVEPVYAATADALDALRAGDVDAVVYLISDESESVGARVDAPTLEAVRAFDASDSVHVLALPANAEAEEVYRRATLTDTDLPELIGDGESVETYRVDTVLGAYRWRDNNPRYEKTKRFVDAFIESIDHLESGPHAAFWGDLDVSAPVHGMLNLQLVDVVLAERQIEWEAEMAAERAAQAAEREAERQAKMAALDARRDQLLELIEQRIGEASDAEELQTLLDQVNGFADRLE